MKIAAIDLGTNSIRLLKGIIDNGVLTVGNKKIASTRLGRGIGSKTSMGGEKILSEESMAHTIRVLKEWSEELNAWGIEDISVIATSAVRDANNKEEFISRVKEQVGLDIDVITGDMEAQLGFCGVMLGVDTTDLCMIIDVGGGSTELIVGDLKHGVRYGESLNIGAVRMSEKFAGEAGSDAEVDREALGRYILDELSGYIKRFDVPEDEGMGENCETEKNCATESGCEKINNNSPTQNIKNLIGIGGTASTFAAVDLKMVDYNRKLIQGHILSERRFSEILDMLWEMSVEQRREVVGLQRERADIINAGGEIIYSAISKFGFKNIMISDFDNLEGIFAKKYFDKFSEVIVNNEL